MTFRRVFTKKKSKTAWQMVIMSERKRRTTSGTWEAGDETNFVALARFGHFRTTSIQSAQSCTRGSTWTA